MIQITMFDPRKDSTLDQLRWFTEILKDHDLPYWIDSGSLLGLMREGKLLDSDHDIDIGVWEKDALQLRKILEQIGYSDFFIVQAQFYEGILLAYSIIPKSSSQILRIDVGIFREHGQYAYLHAPRYTTERNCFYSYVFKGGKYVLHHILRKSKSSRSAGSGVVIYNLEQSHWPFKILLDTRCTWWIPSQYFKKLTTIQIQDPPIVISIPQDWEDYLKFRYGEWRLPVKEWSHWIHDKGFQHKFPQELMEMTRYEY